MANPEHVNVLKQGPGAWNAWRADNPQILPDLCGAFLESVSLDGANLTSARLVRTYLANGYLRNVDLTDANLTDSDLHDANLMGARVTTANLTAADLRDTNLQDASLDGATLRRASLARTYLLGASLLWADLTDADMHLTAFDHANVGWTTFGGNDLSRARGLDSLKHHGPSSIGIDTILRSRGTIPEAFLRGCGVPEDFIAYARSLVGQPIQYYSCFISYSTADQEFANRLYTGLQNRGVRCWFAPHDIQAGKKIHEQIDQAIRVYDRLLLIISEHSMDSEWVKTEIAHARQKELNEQRQVLFPITLAPFEKIRDWKCFDADAGKDSAREIREYFIPDFTNWQDHDNYQAAFLRLLADLQSAKRREPVRL